MFFGSNENTYKTKIKAVRLAQNFHDFQVVRTTLYYLAFQG